MPQWVLQMMGPYALGVSVLKPLLILPNLKSIWLWSGVPKMDSLSQKTKQQLSFFSSRQHKFHSEVLQINGHDINPSDSMTYLGIVLDHKLSWTPHIKKKVSKAKKFLHLIKLFCHS